METKLDYQAAKPAKKRPKWLLAGSGAVVLLAAGAAALLPSALPARDARFAFQLRFPGI